MTISAVSLALTLLVSQPPAVRIAPPEVVAAAPTPRWMVDAPDKRPAGLSALYVTFGALQMTDAYTTRRAIRSGAVEANPLMKGAARNTGTLYAVKAASTAVSIYLAEKAWKKNRKGAVILMAVVNGVTAAVVARNLRNAR
jgi:hypothetical protein